MFLVVFFQRNAVFFAPFPDWSAVFVALICEVFSRLIGRILTVLDGVPVFARMPVLF